MGRTPLDITSCWDLGLALCSIARGPGHRPMCETLMCERFIDISLFITLKDRLFRMLCQAFFQVVFFKVANIS